MRIVLWIHEFIHKLNRHFLSTYFMPGTVLGTRVTSEDKHIIIFFCRVYILRQVQTADNNENLPL